TARVRHELAEDLCHMSVSRRQTAGIHKEACPKNLREVRLTGANAQLGDEAKHRRTTVREQFHEVHWLLLLTGPMIAFEPHLQVYGASFRRAALLFCLPNTSRAMECLYSMQP